MNGVNRFMVGCDCNRPTLDSLQVEGFEVTKVEHPTMKKVPNWASPLIVGSATATAGVAFRPVPLTGQERS